ncbi:MAG: SET domain-containing protein-lysine N-methyltransferase [Candidatus Wildermuthbacteria bacterium]|nr:SET domain-containing protein-lysine N-methyltransferase [Candidatus Wildermuthbacteria bacterium]
MIQSYISNKAKVFKSPIHGYGLFALRRFLKGEIVAIKGGHIIDEKTFARIETKVDESYIQIEDKFYIGAVKKSEVRGNKLFLNHSCNPNVGIRGQVTFVAMRNIKPNEELTYDWAMENDGGDHWVLQCNCRKTTCRKVITGDDWKNPVLQRKYRGFFSAYIQERMKRR